MTDPNIALSPRHERFVLEFLKDGNATRAYVRAGYSPRGAQPSASRLLCKPAIEAAITAGRQRVAAALELSVERLGREYAKVAFANVDDFIQVEDDGRLRVDLEKAGKAQRAGIVELKVSNHRKPEQVVTLKLGKLQALAALTKQVGLFAKKPEPALPTADRERYEWAIAKLGEELWQTKERLEDAEDEREEARVELTAIKMQRIAEDLEASRELGDDPDIPDPDAEEDVEPPQDGAIASGSNDHRPHAEEAAHAAVSKHGPQAASVSLGAGDAPREDPDFSPSPREGQGPRTAPREKVPSDSEADEGLPRATTDVVVVETPESPSSALRAPSPRIRGEKENHSNPCAIAAPEEPRPPIVLKGLGPPDPPRPKRAPSPPPQPQPQPHVAGAGNGTIFWNTARQPPSGLTWHEILRQGGRFPGR